MTAINSGPLTLQSVYRLRESAPTPAPPSRPTYVCAARGCGVLFFAYPGMRRLGSGAGLCRNHNSKEKTP